MFLPLSHSIFLTATQTLHLLQVPESVLAALSRDYILEMQGCKQKHVPKSGKDVEQLSIASLEGFRSQTSLRVSPTLATTRELPEPLRSGSSILFLAAPADTGNSLRHVDCISCRVAGRWLFGVHAMSLRQASYVISESRSPSLRIMQCGEG